LGGYLGAQAQQRGLSGRRAGQVALDTNIGDPSRQRPESGVAFSDARTRDCT
jgi:hypothetical protein